jgi:outer membrane lipoprotein LolB
MVTDYRLRAVRGRGQSLVHMLVHTVDYAMARALMSLSLLGLVGLLLAGCAATPPAPPSGAPAVDDFELAGKLAVVDGANSVSARFRWRQTDDRFAIELWGPLGQGRLRLEGDGRTLRVLDAAGGVLTEGPHEAVMQRELGWTLPLAVLPDWVRGRPHAGMAATAEKTDDVGRLVGFRQLDWSVELGRWSPAPATRATAAQERVEQQALPERPARISASRGQYRVRVAVSDWFY